MEQKKRESIIIEQPHRASPLVLDDGLRAAVEEDLDDLGVALAGGDMHRRAAVGVPEVGVGAGVEELAYPLRVALVGQVHQLEIGDAGRLARSLRARNGAVAASAAAVGRPGRLLSQREPRGRRRLLRRRGRLGLHRNTLVSWSGDRIGDFGEEIE